MKKLSRFLAFLKERLGEKGQGMVEYALILAAVAIIAVAAIWGVGTGADQANSLQKAVVGAFSKAATEVTNAQTAPKANE